jgi:hypothetical protein
LSEAVFIGAGKERGVGLSMRRRGIELANFAALLYRLSDSSANAEPFSAKFGGP